MKTWRDSSQSTVSRPEYRGPSLGGGRAEPASDRPEEVSVDALYQEVWDIALIFDVIDNARLLVDGIETHFEQALAISQAGDGNVASDPIRVFWLDMFQSKSNPDEKRPFVGACCGVSLLLTQPQPILFEVSTLTCPAPQPS